MLRLFGKKKKIRQISKNRRLEYFFSINEYLFNSLYFSKFINNVMRAGKRGLAEKKVYQVLINIKYVLKKNPEFVFNKLHIYWLPVIQLKNIKKAKRYYIIPFLINNTCSQDSLGRKSFISSFQLHKGMSFEKKIQKELYSLYYEEINSNLAKKWNTTIFDGVQNRIYGHFRF